ncbi:bifunctional cobalt-precorrin-7 (C(5))-methyltransferase/cobalt-precorrin-6B (C(15))-methyltransferase [Crocosphaera chwakensis]|uniref:tRNA (guanine(46)-N(7))-methyltransferase n=1 Tax=Crocosphaera chwakensis CCY0110 TaxID=391612 RepID=A3IR67_9CHRO|nr:bifunctional cobalt-precorrin-7 (C(5))-methyltransferase/cobalt-precorrin-6B (C(15))-methyltransferase [Crocosphaera chwakensis]EAZ91057.1 precorrin-6y methylase [Crocosphaera chwakensis CCY0110]
MIKVIGIGLNGKESLTTKIQKIVDNANLLMGSDRHLSYFQDHPGDKVIISNFYKDIKILQQIKSYHESIVILVSGDPLFFGLGRLLLEQFEVEELEFYPNVSSIQLAFSRIKIPWHDATIISGHGRDLDELITSLQQGIRKIAILTDSKNNPQAIANLFLSLNIPINYRIWVCENLGHTNEKVNCFTPQILANLRSDQFAALNVVILVQKNDISLTKKELDNLPFFGIEDHYFLSFKDRPGLMTKKEIRMIILGELGLKSKEVIWDIGAGTGSVSIEIARLCPNSQVFAIEKTAIGINLINKNCQRFDLDNITPVQTKAPDKLTTLPLPNRTFIGGSGGNLIDILDICKEKLVEDGIILVALATLENLVISLDWINKNNCDYQLLNINISRSLSIAHLTRLSPLNPIFLVKIFPK